jgi:hypothetical protein
MLVATRNDLFDVYVWIKTFPFKGKSYAGVHEIHKVIGLCFLGKWLERWGDINAPYFYGGGALKVFKYSKKIIKEFKLC